MEKQERKARMVLFLAFLFTLMALGLLGAAMSSESWVVAGITSRVKDTEDMQTKESYAHHGLFHGEVLRDQWVAPLRYDILVNCDLSTRTCKYEAVDQSTNTISISNGRYDANLPLDLFCHNSTGFGGNLSRPGDISFWSWMATVVFLSLALLFGLIAAVFTMVNVLYVPISDIAGIAGVYVWNLTAALMSVITLCVWGGLYYTHLRYNMLAPSILALDVTSCGTAKHGVGFWLCLGAVVLFLVNIVVIRLRRGTRAIRVKKNALNVKYRKGEETLY